MSASEIRPGETLYSRSNDAFGFLH